MKRKSWIARIIAAAAAIMLFPAVAFADEAGGERTIDLGTFLEEVEAAGYNYDGQGVTVEWSPSSACTNNLGANHTCKVPEGQREPDGNNAQRIQDHIAQYQIFNGANDVSIKNATFTFVPADFTLCMNSPWGGSFTAKQVYNAEFQMQNSGDVEFSGCTFNGALVGLWGLPGNPPQIGDLTVDGCTFNDVDDTYALKDVHSLNATITNSTFNNCSGGIYFDAPSKDAQIGAITIQNNTFSDTGQGFADRGLVQFSGSGVYTDATIDISGNSSTGGSGAIRQLNTTVTDSVLDLDELMANNSFDGNALTKSTYKGSSKFGYDFSVYYNGTTYKTLKEALEAAKANTSATEVKIYCRPGADLGEMTHGPVNKNTTIYGYGAKVTGGERDLAIDTYEPLPTGETTVTVKDLDGIAAWGQRNTDHTINLVFEDCQDMHRVYFTAPDGNNSPINISLNNCSFDGTDDGLVSHKNTSVYSNAPGKIDITNTSFTNIAVGLNINNKSAGTQDITLNNCTFTDCATVGLEANDPTKTYGAPVRVVAQPGAETNLTVTNCVFTTSEGKQQMGNGDILIGDGRFDAKDEQGIVTLGMTGTDADIMVQNAGYYDKDGGIADESKGTVTDADADDEVKPNDDLHFILDNHEETKVIDAKEATCTEEGYTGDTVCAKCGMLIEKGETIAMLSHASDKFATDASHHWKKCDTCGAEFDREEHAFGEWKVTEEATADRTGSKERVCSVCTFVETAEIPKLDEGGTDPKPEPGDPGDNQGSGSLSDLQQQLQNAIDKAVEELKQAQGQALADLEKAIEEARKALESGDKAAIQNALAKLNAAIDQGGSNSKPGASGGSFATTGDTAPFAIAGAFAIGAAAVTAFALKKRKSH